MTTVKGPRFGLVSFERAGDRYDLDVNPILKQAGVDGFPRFVQLLEGYLKGIPEMAQVAAAADRIGAKAVLSGGSARAIIASMLKDIQDEGAAGAVRPKRSLFEMLEGSDVDVLVMSKDGSAVKPEALAKLQGELNRISGAKLVDPLPSVQRRLYTAEWDVVDAHEFATLNKAFGGETPSLMGIGIDEKGALTLFDPHDALKDVFRGKFRYVHGEKPYEHDMVVRGQFDPSLDGLRIIRMAGQMKEVGVEMSEQAIESLQTLGAEANRRAWEIQARVLHSPDGKLQRRWAKYTKKIWIDHKNPLDARALLQNSGFLDVLTLLGLRDYTLHELPPEKRKRVDTHPLVQQFAKSNEKLFEGAVKKGSDVEIYTWQPSKLAQLALEENRVFGVDAGPFGPGLQVSGGAFPEGAIVTTQLRVGLKPGARMLDLTKPGVSEAIEAFIRTAAPSFRSANDHVPVLGDDSRSKIFDDLLDALGVDGAISSTGDGVVTNAGAIQGFVKTRGLDEGLLDQLESRRPGVNKEYAVRALLAAQGQAGLARLRDLIEKGSIKLSDLFPEGAQTGGLFADVPFVDAEFAAFLQSQATKAKDLSEDQRENVRAAAIYLRADLPAEFRLAPARK